MGSNTFTININGTNYISTKPVSGNTYQFVPNPNFVGPPYATCTLTGATMTCNIAEEGTARFDNCQSNGQIISCQLTNQSTQPTGPTRSFLQANNSNNYLVLNLVILIIFIIFIFMALSRNR